MISSRRWTRGIAVICALGTTLAMAACSSSGGGGTTSSSSAPPPAQTSQPPASTSTAAGTSTGAAPAASKLGLDYCGPGAGGKDIVLGGLYTKTPFAFGNDVEKTVQQVFSDCNAKGGINGRKIKFVSGDDGGDVTKTGALARKIVDAGAIALVGSASFTSCGVNGQYYHDQGLIDIEAVGVAPQCFTSPDIASVLVSPFSQVTVDLYYATEKLGSKKPCFFQPVTPGTTDAIVAAIKAWQKITGKKLTIDDHKIPTNQTSFTTELARAKSAGCDAIVYGGGDTVAAAMLKDAKNQGMTNVNFMYVSVSYTSNLAKAAGKLGMNVYATTGIFPFTSTDPATDAWRAAATAGKAQQTAFSMAGYISANWGLSVLGQIKGDITKASFAQQVRGDSVGYKSPLVPVPLVFGTAKAHDRTSGINMMTLKDGAWQKAEEVSLPSS